MIMNTHESYVSLETAKLLKETGFDWEVYKCYETLPENKKIFGENLVPYQGKAREDVFPAPTLDVTQRWLREVKNYYVSVEVDCDSIGVFYTVRYIFQDGNNYNTSHIWEKDELGEDNYRRLKLFNTHEEALETGIINCLRNLVSKRK